MAHVFEMGKSVGFRRLGITGLLGVWLSIFAGNAAAVICQPFATPSTTSSDTVSPTCGNPPPPPPPPPNAPPAVSITSPANNAIFTAPATVSLTANATDSDGTVARVEFYDSATFLGQGTANGSNYSLTWTNVSVGTHAVTAKATDNGGALTTSGTINLTVNPTAPPNAPSGLTATTNSMGGVNLAWIDASDNETGFKLERKTGSGGTYAQIATPSANATTYADSGLAVGTLYYYRVRSTNSAADSAYSNEASAVAAPPNATNGSLEYKYDPFGNPIQTNAGGVITTAIYDLRGRKTSMSDPDMGNWTYAYNAASELVRQTDTNGKNGRMQYDRLGRMTVRTEDDLISKWFYDCYPDGTCPNVPLAPEWNASLLTGLFGKCANGTGGTGKLCYVSADNGYRRLLTYDSLGRSEELNTLIDTSHLVTTSYVASGIHAGKVDTITYPTGFGVRYSYHDSGYLLEVRVANPSANPDFATDGTLLWQATGRSASGLVNLEKLGNGLDQFHYLNLRDRLKSVGASLAGIAVHSLLYSYDAVGNVTQRVDNVNGVTENFSYDTLNRLLSASGPGLVTRSFDYDAIGNITYKSDVGIYGYGSRPHAVTSVTGTVNASYTYDANGNLSSGAGRSVLYMSFNLPRAITDSGATYTYTYTYSPEHERVKLLTQLATGTQTSIYLHPGGPGRLFYEKEIRPDGTLEHKHYVQAETQLVGVYVTKSVYVGSDTKQMRYYHSDNLGSIVAISNEAGARSEALAYEAFGERRYPSGLPEDRSSPLFGMTTDRGFTAQEHLDELGLIHMNGRVYDPILARFMTPDPGVPSPLNLQSFNRYSYAYNNPLRITDPSGFEGVDQSGGGGGNLGLFSPSDLGLSNFTMRMVLSDGWGSTLTPFNSVLWADSDRSFDSTGFGYQYQLPDFMRGQGLLGAGNTFGQGNDLGRGLVMGLGRSMFGSTVGTINDAGTGADQQNVGQILFGAAKEVGRGVGRLMDILRDPMALGLGSKYENTFSIDTPSQRVGAAVIELGAALGFGIIRAEKLFAAGETTYLYQKVGASGEHLKFGITNDPATRYTAAELNGGSLRIIAQGERSEMLQLERNLHTTLPIGSEERQLFYIQKQVEKGLIPPPYPW